MRYKIVILDGKGMNPGDLPWDKITSLGDTVIYDNTTYEQIVPRSKNADIVVVNKCRFDRNIIQSLPELKFICESATGYDNIDIEAAAERGIPVSNVRGYSTNSVVQHTFALILALRNKCEYYSGEVKKGRWSHSDFFTFWDFPIYELAGKTLGVYGFGKIGSKVASIGQAFGMKVLATRKNPEKGFPPGIKAATFEQLLKESDILTLHAPLTKENHNIINAGTLKMMKDTALLINTARGKMIDEEALRQALDNGIIAGAALDVLSAEPPPADNPLLGAKNCIITPHIAWTSVEARKALMEGVAQNIEAFIKGKPINTVNDIKSN